MPFKPITLPASNRVFGPKYYLQKFTNDGEIRSRSVQIHLPIDLAKRCEFKVGGSVDVFLGSGKEAGQFLLVGASEGQGQRVFRALGKSRLKIAFPWTGEVAEFFPLIEKGMDLQIVEKEGGRLCLKLPNGKEKKA